ncbi:MAG: hypothetical protein TREMPRED_001619 [Tremellales sp. Tagirdzhanova-0007]|nr:MAG: hypothetical protein TREMPRED_001619 [Tremellales sp. Tagirdzhanova-0007]
MATLINQFITHVAQIFAAGEGEGLVASIPLEQGHHFWTPLKQALNTISSSGAIGSDIVSQLPLLSSDAKEPFVPFLLALLRHIEGPGDQVRPYLDFQRHKLEDV